jgi:hypothetical protein
LCEKTKKAVLPKQENGLESGADSQRPFSKQKSRDSWGFRAPKIPADSHMIFSENSINIQRPF